MELRQLRHFVILAEEMHFGRAARRLFMTQPPLSASIMRLEEELGVRLFERDSKRVVLTPAGAQLLERARETLAQADKTVEFARAVAVGNAGRIEVGFTGTLLYRGLPAILARFHKDYPLVELGLREISTQDQISAVREGKLDAGFINTLVPPAWLESMVIFRERFVVCLPEGHALAHQRQIDLADVREEAFVMFGKKGSPAFYDHVVGLCESAGFTPKMGVEVGQFLSVAAMVASGFGVSVVPESVSRAGIKGAAFVPFRGSEVRPTAHLVWSPAATPTPGLQALIDTTRALRASE